MVFPSQVDHYSYKIPYRYHAFTVHVGMIQWPHGTHGSQLSESLQSILFRHDLLMKTTWNVGMILEVTKKWWFLQYFGRESPPFYGKNLNYPTVPPEDHFPLDSLGYF